IKARACTPDISPALALAHREHEGAEICAAAARRDETYDHHRLLLARLDLQPFACAEAGMIEATRELRDDAFLVRTLGAGEGLNPLASDMLAVKEKRAFRLDLF